MSGNKDILLRINELVEIEKDTEQEIKATEERIAKLETEVQRNENVKLKKENDANKAKQKWQEIESNEPKNSNGIHKDSRLKVTVVSGSGLKTKDKMGKGDPYILLDYCGKEEKTEVDQNWAWNQEFTFGVANPESSLLVKAMDWNRWGGDDITGEGLVELNDLYDQEWHDMEVELTESNKEAGLVNTKMQWFWSEAPKFEKEYKAKQKEVDQQQQTLQQVKEELDKEKESLAPLKQRLQETRDERVASEEAVRKAKQEGKKPQEAVVEKPKPREVPETSISSQAPPPNVSDGQERKKSVQEIAVDKCKMCKAKCLIF